MSRVIAIDWGRDGARREEQAGGAGEDTAAEENGVRVVVWWVTGNLIKDRMIVTLIGGHLSGAETCVPCSWGAL